MKFLRNKWFLALVVLLVVVAIGAFTLRGEKATQYFTAPVTKGDIRSVVEATGTINAVTTVQVGSQVSGTILNLSADFNSKVKKGQVIARIDPSLFHGALLQAQADLANAKANVAASKANLEKSKASAIQAKQDYDRTVGLTREGVMSKQQLDAAKATYDASVAQVNSNEAALIQAQAQVQQRTAAVTVAQTNVDHCTITAPIDGTVIARNVDVGQTVAASLQAPTLFTIAQDLQKMQVYAKTDESDVGQIRPGQKVTFKVDAFPKDTFHGVVSQVRMNATTVQNVVTYDTVVSFDNPDSKLFPGMTAYVSIPVAEATDVISISNGAIRYKPDMSADKLQALLQQQGIGQGRRGQDGSQSSEASGSGPATAQPAARRKPSQDGEASAAQAPKQTRSDVAVVWKLNPQNKTLEPALLKLGITDRSTTEVQKVLKGSLNMGDQLIIGSSNRPASTATRPGAAPGGGMRR